jgi:hypothetical protein
MRLPDQAHVTTAPAAVGLRASTGHGRLAGREPLLLALASLPWLVLALLPPLNHDVGGLLQFTERWLAGDALYRDLIDVNPPLIFVLNLVPAALARVTSLAPATALNLCVLAFTLACLAMAFARARPHATYADGGAAGPARFALWALLPFAAFGLSNSMFGQREQLLALAALPYLFDAATRAAGAPAWRRTLPAALLAAVGFALKPHYLAGPLLVEAWLLARRGLPVTLRDPVPWAMGAAWLLYGASVKLFFPDYLNVVVPLVRDYYAALGRLEAWRVALGQNFAATVFTLLLCLPFAFRRGREPAAMLVLAALGAILGAALQGKDWAYHRLPAEIFTVLAAGWLASLWLSRLAGAAAARRAALGFSLAVLAIANAYALGTREGPWLQLQYRHSTTAALVRILRAEAADAPVLALSPALDPIYPALNYAHAWQAMRFMNVWLLQAAYATCPEDGRRYRETWQMDPAEAYVFRAVAEDFDRRRPPVLIIDRWSGIRWCGGDFDFLAYFMRHKLFADAFSHYRESRQYDRYRIFTRID